MEKKARGRVRGMLALGLLGALVTGLISSPVGAHFVPSHEKKHVVKIARQQATRRINALVPGMIAAADSVRETKMFTLGDGESRTVVQHGAFTVTANCDLDAGANDTANMLIATTQDNSSFDSWDENDDFDIGDLATDRDWGPPITVAANTTEAEANVGDGVAVAPDGTTLVLVSAYTAVNPPFALDRCAFAAAHVVA
jgi:hypothetical protein